MARLFYKRTGWLRRADDRAMRRRPSGSPPSAAQLADARARLASSAVGAAVTNCAETRCSTSPASRRSGAEPRCPRQRPACRGPPRFAGAAFLGLSDSQGAAHPHACAGQATADVEGRRFGIARGPWPRWRRSRVPPGSPSMSGPAPSLGRRPWPAVIYFYVVVDPRRLDRWCAPAASFRGDFGLWPAGISRISPMKSRQRLSGALERQIHRPNPEPTLPGWGSARLCRLFAGAVG